MTAAAPSRVRDWLADGAGGVYTSVGSVRTSWAAFDVVRVGVAGPRTRAGLGLAAPKVRAVVGEVSARAALDVLGPGVEGQMMRGGLAFAVMEKVLGEEMRAAVPGDPTVQPVVALVLANV